MRGWLALSFLVAAGCGSVSTHSPDAGGTLGATCSGDTACTSGHCVDGVCCASACDGTCEACSAAKTGTADGTCSPVTAATDPDNECPMGCADGTVTNQCDGHGACATTSCGGYQCSSATACGTSCVSGSGSDCTESSFCDANMTCQRRLRVALVAGVGSCLLTPNDAYPAVAALLIARGHIPVYAFDTDVDTLAKMKQFDVIITGGPGNSGCTHVNWSTFDGVIADYVNGGGAVVAAGWTLYNGANGVPSMPTNLLSIMPNSGVVYLSATNTLVTPTGNDPISMGLGTFNAPDFVPYGGPTPKAGATVIATAGANPVAESWTVGSGRVVFLAPLYFEARSSYPVQALTDGSQPNSVELLMRSIEWAAKERN